VASVERNYRKGDFRAVNLNFIILKFEKILLTILEEQINLNKLKQIIRVTAKEGEEKADAFQSCLVMRRSRPI
jgi:hypothetical protein